MSITNRIIAKRTYDRTSTLTPLQSFMLTFPGLTPVGVDPATILAAKLGLGLISEHDDQLYNVPYYQDSYVEEDIIHPESDLEDVTTVNVMSISESLDIKAKDINNKAGPLSSDIVNQLYCADISLPVLPKSIEILDLTLKQHERDDSFMIGFPMTNYATKEQVDFQATDGVVDSIFASIEEPWSFGSYEPDEVDVKAKFEFQNMKPFNQPLESTLFISPMCRWDFTNPHTKTREPELMCDRFVLLAANFKNLAMTMKLTDAYLLKGPYYFRLVSGVIDYVIVTTFRVEGGLMLTPVNLSEALKFTLVCRAIVATSRHKGRFLKFEDVFLPNSKLAKFYHRMIRTLGFHVNFDHKNIGMVAKDIPVTREISTIIRQAEEELGNYMAIEYIDLLVKRGILITNPREVELCSSSLLCECDRCSEIEFDYTIYLEQDPRATKYFKDEFMIKASKNPINPFNEMLVFTYLSTGQILDLNFSKEPPLIDFDHDFVLEFMGSDLTKKNRFLDGPMKRPVYAILNSAGYPMASLDRSEDFITSMVLMQTG
jgi:hypothetical protein